MIIAVDIDDTLTNSFDYFMPYVAEFFGVDYEYVKKNNISYSNFPQNWKDRELEFCKKYYDKIVPNTPFKENAVSVINKLKAKGHKIFVVTARTTDFYTDPVKTTKEELDKNNLSYDDVICTFDKAKFCKEICADIFIDDSIRNCESVRDAGIKTLLFTSPVNIDIKTTLKRVSSWDEIYKKINK